MMQWKKNRFSSTRYFMMVSLLEEVAMPFHRLYLVEVGDILPSVAFPQSVILPLQMLLPLLPKLQ